MYKFVGIDEVGRGPLAGPVAVGAVAVPKGFDVRREFPRVADSKLLSPRVREQIFDALQKRLAAGDLQYAVSFSSASYIDTHGIIQAVVRALTQALTTVAPDYEHTDVLLDGSLFAPKKYAHQQTIIRGDISEPVISLASIAAKVTRDRLMVRLHEQYPVYGFAAHKGYGTVVHRRAIALYGLSPLHRRTFIHNKSNK